MVAAAVSCIQVLAESAVQRHGSGAVLAIMEALVKARSTRIESAPHGCFVKMFFPRKDSRPQGDHTSPERSSSSLASSTPPSPCLQRDEILDLRPPPGLHAGGVRVDGASKYVEVFDMDVADNEPERSGGSVGRRIFEDDACPVYMIKNTFVHIDDSAGGDDNASSLSAPPGFVTPRTVEPVPSGPRCTAHSRTVKAACVIQSKWRSRRQRFLFHAQRQAALVLQKFWRRCIGSKAPLADLDASKPRPSQSKSKSARRRAKKRNPPTVHGKDEDEAQRNGYVNKFEPAIKKIAQRLASNMAHDSRLSTPHASEQGLVRKLLDKSEELFRLAVVAALKMESGGREVLVFQCPKFIVHEEEPTWVRNVCQQRVQDFYEVIKGSSLIRICSET